MSIPSEVCDDCYVRECGERANLEFVEKFGHFGKLYKSKDAKGRTIYTALFVPMNISAAECCYGDEGAIKEVKDYITRFEGYAGVVDFLKYMHAI